jgi:hypothetical protein
MLKAMQGADDRLVNASAKLAASIAVKALPALNYRP